MSIFSQVINYLNSTPFLPAPEGIIGSSHGVTQPVRTEAKIGRNSLCPCGSTKKYKHCCLQKD